MIQLTLDLQQKHGQIALDVGSNGPSGELKNLGQCRNNSIHVVREREKNLFILIADSRYTST